MNLNGNERVFETRSRLGRPHDPFETRSASASNNDLQEAKEQFSLSAAETADVLSKENLKERIRTPRGKVTAPASTSFKKPVGVKISRIIAVLVVLFVVLNALLPKLTNSLHKLDVFPNDSTYLYETNLGEGTYTVGIDLPEGSYDIVCISGEGDMECLALKDSGYVDQSFHTKGTLSDGDVVLIAGTAVLRFSCETAEDSSFAPEQSI